MRTLTPISIANAGGAQAANIGFMLPDDPKADITLEKV